MSMPRLLALLFISLLGLTSCQTTMVFSTPTADWQSYIGQMHYANNAGRSVIGEVVVRRPVQGGDFQLQFSSGPGIPLLKLSESDDGFARAEGIFARGHWQGKIASAPAHLKNWVQLRDVFSRISPGVTDLRGPGWTATVSYAGGRAEHCEVAFTENGERFSFQFSR